MQIRTFHMCFTVKNEPASTNSDPYCEVISYYIYDNVKVKYQKSSAPSFLIKDLGASLTISGAVYGENVYVDRLVELIWLVNQEMNSEFREQIVRTLKALKVAVKELDEYYQPCFLHHMSKNEGIRVKYIEWYNEALSISCWQTLGWHLSFWPPNRLAGLLQ